MLSTYLPAIVFLILGTVVGGAFTVLNTLFGPRKGRRPTHDDPYECGLPSEIQRGFRFGISFYLIAMLFILFDIEVVFLYPVADPAARRSGRSRSSRSRSSSYCCLAALIYVWRRGALEWR